MYFEGIAHGRLSWPVVVRHGWVQKNVAGDILSG